MSTRPILLVTLATVGPFPFAAQIPDSLAHPGLPDNPVEYARQIARESNERGVGSGAPDMESLYEAGCVSDDGWTTATFDEMYRIARTDAMMTYELASSIGTRFMSRHPLPCDAGDRPGFEAWIRTSLRDMWESGKLSPDYAEWSAWARAWTGPSRAMSRASDPDSRELIRSIAFDADVKDRIRYRAAHVMSGHRAMELSPEPTETREEGVSLQLDAVGGLLRDFFYELPESWVLDTMSFLLSNERISVDEHLEMQKRLAKRAGWPNGRG